jgi:hypothetical protein
MIDITGNTRLYGIVADPVAQVKTPQTMRKKKLSTQYHSNPAKRCAEPCKPCVKKKRST